MELLHPGVYIQEVSSGVQPIAGVSTSTTAFLGKAAMGPLDQVVMVTSFTEFQASYGGFLSDGYLAHAALQFFNNGGKRLYVGRVAHNATTASVTIADRETAPVGALQLSASSAGAWADAITVVVADGTNDPGDEFKLTVSNAGTTVQVFDNLSMNPDVSNFVGRVVGASPQYLEVTPNSSADSTVPGTSVSAATAAVMLPADRRALQIDVNNDGLQTIALADPVTSGAEIATAIQTAVRALTPLMSTTAAGAFSGFTAAFNAGVYTLTSGATGKRSAVSVSNAPGANNAATLLGLGTTNGGTESTGAAVLRPAAGTYSLSGATVSGNVTAAANGGDGGTPQDSDFINAFTLLDPVQDVNIVAVPGIGTLGVVAFGAGYCAERGDCFFVGDMAPTDSAQADGETFVSSLATKTSYGAVYFPWVQAVDPTGQSPTPILLPPSGYVTGIYARTDSQRGVWKAPAGTQATLSGSAGLASIITDGQQDTLNPLGANVIRFFPSAGVVVWGARTLATLSDPEYRYVPVRRLAIFLEQSIYQGIQWAVFEPNDDGLWSSLRLDISAFMMNQFRAGAFQGDTPSQAFMVKCDADTNPQSQIDAGIVTVLVGFAPVKPAEFVVLQISQQTAGAVS